MVRLSTYRAMVRAAKEDYRLTRAAHLNPKDRVLEAQLGRASRNHHEAFVALCEELGIDNMRPVSPDRMRMQQRVLRSVNRCAGIDWSKVYDPEVEQVEMQV